MQKKGWSENYDRPLYIETGANSAFWFAADAELLFAAEGILGSETNSIYTNIFGSENISYYRDKYRLACEIKDICTNSGYEHSVFMFLHGFNIREFSLNDYRGFIACQDNIQGKLLGVPDSSTVEEFEDLKIFNNYLETMAYFANVDKYIDEIFSLAEELRTSHFYETLDKYKNSILSMEKSMTQTLANTEPMDYSDQLMRKDIKRRGPYSFFTFSPSVFAYRTIRFMKEDQFLFTTVRDALYDNAYILSALKAITDDTRFKIIALLKERKTMQGVDIAAEIGLTAPTVSHHMKILKAAGLVLEENEGNSKYYHIPKDLANTLADMIHVFLS